MARTRLEEGNPCGAGDEGDRSGAAHRPMQPPQEGGSLLQVLTPPSRFQFCYLAQHWPCRFWPKACPALATSIPKILAQRLLLASIDGWCWKPRWNFHVMLMPPGNRRSRITNYVFYYCFVRGEGFLEVRKCSSLSGNSTVSLKFLVKFLHF